ncbi:MAG: RNA polymerase sigma factor [Bacteroidales bacterium]|nr:RNA polymerase sigma factor [Bacteroidales bacterium]
MDNISDIIGKCRSGDRQAFRLLVKNFHRLVFTIALKMLASEDLAKDIVQETFIRVWQNLDSYDDSRKFSTWICTIASRLCIDELDKQKRTAPMPDDERFLAELVDADTQHQLENKEWARLVNVMAQDLSPKQQLVFTLVQLQEMESTEVQEITGMDADRIKKNLYVARQTIRERLIRLGYGK